ncbi:MAG: STAS domain-containing protein [Planctomycetota bacterium]|jgi:anti-anti-sigma factor
MGALNIAFKEVAGDYSMAVAAIAGSIDANTVGAFQKELEAARQKGKTRLILDLSEVKYVNSTGLGSLVKEQDLFKTGGGGIVLLKVPAKVKIVIEMLGLHTFFDMCDSLQEAIGAIKGTGAVVGEKTAADSVPTTQTQRLKMPASGSARTTPLSSKRKAAAPSKKTAQPKSSRRVALTSSRKVAAAAAGGDTVICSVCGASLELPDPGTYQCPRCSTMMKVESDRSASFYASDEPIPIQMVLLATPECADGLYEFVGVVAKKLSFGGAAVREFQRSVMEVCDKIRTEAYGQSDDNIETFQVMINVNQNKIGLTFTDHGKSLGGGNTDKALVVLRSARSGIDMLEVQPHPNGGNIITISKSF